MSGAGDGRTPGRAPAVFAAVVSLAVMGGVVAMALGGRGTDADRSPDVPAEVDVPPRLPGDPFGDPDMAGCTAVDPDNPPVLAFDLSDGVADFGPVRQGERRTMEVTFRNAGRGLLCVTRVATGCGCLKVRLKNLGKKTFNPGETGVIVLTLDTTNREGELKKKVDVFSNDLVAPMRGFTMRCDIALAVVASPSKIHFGQHPRNTPSKAEILLKSPKEDASWEVTGVNGTRRTLDGAHVSYDYAAVDTPDPKFRVVRLTINHPGLDTPGPFRDGIVIKTTHRERPEVLIEAHYVVVERIIPIPRRVPLGFISPGAKRPPRRVLLRPGGTGVRFEITDVTVEAAPGRPPLKGRNGGFATEHGVEKGVAYVDVRYDGTSRGAGLIEAVLVVHTTDPQMPTVRIPVTATVRAR